MLFRILTEDRNREQIRQTVAEKFEMFALIPSEGNWKGQAEKSITIEIDTSTYNVPTFQLAEMVRQIAKRIKEINNQEAVLIQRLEPESVLV